MELPDAWHQLGISPTSDTREIRAAFLGRLHLVHPDRSESPQANDDTVALTAAYRLVVEHVTTTAADTDASMRPVVPIGMVGDDTIAVALPPDETFTLLIEAAHRLGEITHVEASSGMLQLIVEFVEAPTCQLLMTVQRRAATVTEVICTVESLEAEPGPPTNSVAKLLLEGMVAVSQGS